MQHKHTQLVPGPSWGIVGWTWDDRERAESSFHGHTHNRLCQLQHLATYVKGLGLEDLEGCKCAFSKSNALTSSICYASVFHRMQAISTYFEHNDTFEVYQNLS